MKSVVAMVFVMGCTSRPDSALGIYEVTQRNFDPSAECTAPGKPTPPAVPYFELTMNDAEQLAYSWCVSPTQCPPLNSLDWFDADGDRWRRALAIVAPLPDEAGTHCSLGYDTLAIEQRGAMVHVDLLRRSTSGDPADCTTDRAIALLASAAQCSIVDRYDLVRVP